MFDVKKEKPRWKVCVREANSELGNAVGRLFVESYFDENAKAVVSTFPIRYGFKPNNSNADEKYQNTMLANFPTVEDFWKKLKHA